MSISAANMFDEYKGLNIVGFELINSGSWGNGGILCHIRVFDSSRSEEVSI